MGSIYIIDTVIYTITNLAHAFNRSDVQIAYSNCSR